jgi:multidrug efflux pump
VTRVIEDELSGVSGIACITSQSRDETSADQGRSCRPGTDLDAAAADVRDRVSAARRDLPEGIEEPVVEKASADDFAAMYVILRSERMGSAELTDLAERRVVDALGIVRASASVEVQWRPALRRCASGSTARRSAGPRGITRRTKSPPRLRAENVEAPAGRLETRSQEITLPRHHAAGGCGRLRRAGDPRRHG